jgi:3-hydroxyacyl-CoA dehydrogenase
MLQKMVIEAVFEKLSVKKEVFRKLAQICNPHAILATNTSTLNVDAIAESAGPHRVDKVKLIDRVD